jgi:hypothetical protein
MYAEECYTNYDICISIFKYFGTRCQKGGRIFLITLILFSSVCKSHLRVAVEDSKGFECFSLFSTRYAHCFLFDFPPVWLPSGVGILPHANVQTYAHRISFSVSHDSLLFYWSLVGNLLRLAYVSYGAIQDMTCVKWLYVVLL